MNEAILKSSLKRRLDEEPKLVVFRHEDRNIAGVPDISVTGGGYAAWYEVKFANPDFHHRGIQDLNMLKLDGVGRAFYIIYEEANGDRKRGVTFVRPRDLSVWRRSEWRTTGKFDHAWVVEQIRRLHT